jgi:HD domain
MSITTKFEDLSFQIVIRRLAYMRFQARARRIFSALGLRRRGLYHLSDLEIPDSNITKKATALVTELSPNFLVNHCIRTFLFGAALGLRDGKRFDPELLYLAAIMHDLGFTDHLSGLEPFELEGAAFARNFLLDNAYDERKADLVHEAIALHSSLGIIRREPEIALIQRGVGLDVVGLRFSDLARTTIAEIIAAYPRLQFKKQVMPLVKKKVFGKPNCPLAYLLMLGFERRVLAAPFAD